MAQEKYNKRKILAMTNFEKQVIDTPDFQAAFDTYLAQRGIISYLSVKNRKDAFTAGAKFALNKTYDKSIYNEFFARVFDELKMQDKKWGSQRRKHPLEWQSILVEEVGEIAKEMCDNSFQSTLPQNYEVELIQAAAVLFRMYAQNRINILGENFKKEY